MTKIINGEKVYNWLQILKPFFSVGKKLKGVKSNFTELCCHSKTLYTLHDDSIEITFSEKGE